MAEENPHKYVELATAIAGAAKIFFDLIREHQHQKRREWEAEQAENQELANNREYRQLQGELEAMREQMKAVRLQAQDEASKMVEAAQSSLKAREEDAARKEREVEERMRYLEGEMEKLEESRSWQNWTPLEIPLDIAAKVIKNVKVSNRELGQGAEATVYAGKMGDKKVAVKVYQTPVVASHMHTVLRDRQNGDDIQMLSELKHPNIVKFYGIIAFKKEGGTDVLAAVFERADCSLEDVLFKGQKELPPQQKYSVVYQVCLGLEYLHSKKVIHSDIKPANILLLIEGNQSFIAKLTDFGVANYTKKMKSQTTSMRTRAGATLIGGTAAYMAKELFGFGARVTFESDVWALGITILETLTEEHVTTVSPTTSAQHPRWFIDEALPPTVHRLNQVDKSLVTRMLKYKKEERPQMSTICSMLRSQWQKYL